MTPRFFLAHSKAITDDDLEELTSIASGILDRLAEGKEYDLVLARAHFEARFKACGSWDAWCTEVATGLDYPSRSPLFRAILVPDGPVGAGTSKIIERALGAHRPVFIFDRAGSVWRAARVACVDARDWQCGWRVV